MGAKEGNEKLVGALTSGLSVLRYLQRANMPVGVTQVARDLGLNPSTCFNLLRTLVHEGLVSFDPVSKSYTLSIGVVALARGLLDSHPNIKVLHHDLERLADRYGVAMNLWEATRGYRVILVDAAEQPATVRISMRIGQRLPMFVGALGRCFAAYSNAPLRTLEEEFKKLRLAHELSFPEWMKQVHETRERGYAVDEGYFSKGITTASAVIRDGEAPPRLALSAVGISAQLDGPILADLCEELKAIGTYAMPNTASEA